MSYLRRMIPALLVAFALVAYAVASPSLWPLAGETSVDWSLFPEESLEADPAASPPPVVVAALPEPLAADVPDATRFAVSFPIGAVPDWPEPDLIHDLDRSRVAPPAPAPAPAPPPRQIKPRRSPAAWPQATPTPAQPEPQSWAPRHPRPDPVGLPPPWQATVFEF